MTEVLFDNKITCSLLLKLFNKLLSTIKRDLKFEVSNEESLLIHPNAISETDLAKRNKEKNHSKVKAPYLSSNKSAEEIFKKKMGKKYFQKNLVWFKAIEDTINEIQKLNLPIDDLTTKTNQLQTVIK